jgi:hypothetical protein
MRQPSPHIRFLVLVCALFYCFNTPLSGQDLKTDTAFFLAGKKGLLGKLGKSISVNNPDILLPPNGAVKNDSVFRKFGGKIIRHIRVEKLGFSKSVNDTARVSRNFFNELGDALHTSTRKQVILNNLFFSKGDSLYPYLMADNERFLRELTYLQDAKIMVKEAESSPDSVDVAIICKDVFPFGGSADAGSITNIAFELNDDNIMGTGDRFQVQSLYDMDRRPNYGAGVEYLKRNIAGTFINLALGYQTQATAFNSGRREEKNFYVRGELPLVSPYHAWTGGFDAAIHFTENAYIRDSLYRSDFKYSYRLADAWAGYNLGARSNIRQNLNTRLKRFIALRGIHQTFDHIPDIYQTHYNFSYSNLASVLGAFTIFEQDYYHTNFLYGFGRNEDVPEGFSLSFTGGWSNRNNLSRPYLGFDYQRNYFSDRKNYINYTIRAGAFINEGNLEDISFLTSVEYFTRLRKLGKSKWLLRHFISGSITQQARIVLNGPLLLSSIYGIPQLSNENIRASTRVTCNMESVFYNTWKFFGFSFAPFSFVNLSYLKQIGVVNFSKGDIYTAIGAGIRTRNENLVFGTMELRTFYFPRTTGNLVPWNISFTTNLIYKYNSQFIRKPDFAVVN